MFSTTTVHAPSASAVIASERRAERRFDAEPTPLTDFSPASDFIARVDRASNTRWLDGRLVPLVKPQIVQMLLCYAHPLDDALHECFPYRCPRSEAAELIRAARRDKRLVERSVRGYEIEVVR